MAAHDLAALGPWLDAAFGPAPMGEVARVADVKPPKKAKSEDS